MHGFILSGLEKQSTEKNVELKLIFHESYLCGDINE